MASSEQREIESELIHSVVYVETYSSIEYHFNCFCLWDCLDVGIIAQTAKGYVFDAMFIRLYGPRGLTSRCHA